MTQLSTGPSITGPQLASPTRTQKVGFIVTPSLVKPLKVKDSDLRKMRCDPTIALGRAFAMAPGVASEWSIDADDGVPDDIVAFLRTVLFPMRTAFMEDALGLGDVDFGWVAFEVVWRVEEDGKWWPSLKQLIHDRTKILVAPDTGEFVGVVQQDLITAHTTVVPASKLVLINYRVEGNEWYGNGLLQNLVNTYNAWENTNDAARRYDNKVAGANWHIEYPFGHSVIDGVEVDNFEIAETLKSSIVASGVVTTQKSELPDNSRKISLLGDNTARQTSFVNRLTYLDKQKIRGIHMPERSVLEGQFGTKAEAETHGSVALTIQQIAVDHATDLLNEQLVNWIVLANFGPEHVGRVRLKNADLVDIRRKVLQQVLDKLLASPVFVGGIGEAIDIDAIMDELGVPKTDVVVSITADDDTGGEDDGDEKPGVVDEALGIDPADANDA